MSTYVYLPGRLYDDMMDSIEDAPRNYSSGASEALAAYNEAVPVKRGRGWAYRVAVTSRAAADVLRAEAEYRWEMSGGNGNPYGVTDLADYAALRRAAKVGLDRIDAALADWGAK